MGIAKIKKFPKLIEGMKGKNLAAGILLGNFLLPGTGLQAAAVVDTSNDLNWAFEPVSTVDLPASAVDTSGSEIDYFISAQLEKRGIEPNGSADRRVLIRRAYFDLIGLPPTPEQVEAFLADDSPEAFAKVVDELLASPHYGERWGRHWLDLARYGDTSGDGADTPIPEARLYRDYVIDAFNRDMPYDQFITEQIAGDLWAKEEGGNRLRERIIATGYVALARRFGNRAYDDMHLVIDNTLTTIGKGMLGLNLSCARCHDHKFDPVSIEDYYGLYGYFSSTQYPHPGTEHGRERKNFAALPEEGEIAYAVFDKMGAKGTGDSPLFRRGNPKDPGEIIPRGFLHRIKPKKAEIPARQSGRLQLARWIASPENPLTARVMVNRIWQYHFSKGLVATSSDFGNQGKPPTHPQLLDWLAQRFIEENWSIKAMHRLIMASAAYQRSSAMQEEKMHRDPSNEGFWRYPRHRLQAEPIRDAILYVSGRLQMGNPGRHAFPEPNENNEYPFTQSRPFFEDYNHEYRSVYLPSRRLGKRPYMATFDGPDTNECTGNRRISTVPLQSLFWMNSDFIRDNSRSMAERLLAAGYDMEDRLSMAYQLVLARPPTEKEKADFAIYLGDYREQLDGTGDPRERDLRAWASISQILLASNEFCFIE